MAGENDAQYEASDEASESELLDKSLSVWRGQTQWNVKEVFDPVPLDLHTASSIGQYDCVRSFIQSQQVDLNRRNRGGWTPLMYACYIGHDNIVNLLLDAGVNVNIKNHKGQSPLMLAASCGNESVGYFLCQQGAEIEARDHKGWTALFHATYAGHQNMVKFLLEQGADMNAVEPSLGVTPFMEAAAEGHEIIVQTFLQYGVNVNSKGHNGDTARSLAIMHGHIKIVSLIDNHVLPFSCLRPEAGLDRDLSSSDEAYPTRKHQPSWGHRTKSKKPCIRDGPDAIARLIDRSRHPDPKNKHPNVPKGYVTVPQTEADTLNSPKLSYRDVTSPINPQDYHLSSSGGRDSCDNDGDDDGNAFSKTGALTIKSSSGSSGGLVAAFGLKRDNSCDSEEFHPRDSCSSNASHSSLEGSAGGLELKVSNIDKNGDIVLGGSAVSPVASFSRKSDENNSKEQSYHVDQKSNVVPDHGTNLVPDHGGSDLLSPWDVANHILSHSENKRLPRKITKTEMTENHIHSGDLSSQNSQTHTAPKLDSYGADPRVLSHSSPVETNVTGVDPCMYSGTPVQGHLSSPHMVPPGVGSQSNQLPVDLRVQATVAQFTPNGVDPRVHFPPPGVDPGYQITSPQPPGVDPGYQITSPQPPGVDPGYQITSPQPSGVDPGYQITSSQPQLVRVESHSQSSGPGSQIQTPASHSPSPSPNPQIRMHFPAPQGPNGTEPPVNNGCQNIFQNIGPSLPTQQGYQLFSPNPGSPESFFDHIKIDKGQPQDLAALLEQLGLTKYLAIFEEQDVDLQVFLSLTDNDLKEIGIKLFGPRKKLTNAIARWHSKARPSSNDLEQAYADRLEGEMQEMALQLHKAYEQVSTLQAQVLQEQQIRNVAERCVVEEHGMWQHIHRIVADTRQKCDEMKEILRKLKHYHSEIKLKIQQPMTSADTKHISDLTNAIKQDLRLDDRTGGSTNHNAAGSSSAENIVKHIEIHMKELQQSLALITKNSDKLLGKTSGEIAHQQGGGYS